MAHELTTGQVFKMPRGEEMMFAGRWLKVVEVRASVVDCVLTNGKLVSFGRAGLMRALEAT